MKAYRTQATITDSKQLVLSDVPFGAGEKVEIEVWAANGSGTERTEKLKELFKTTQALQQIKTLTEDDILNEIDAYRNGK